MSEYVGISMLDVEELNIIEYLQYRRDAFITKLNRTEKGHEYLENAYRLALTEPDRKTLRSKFGGE